ncbi:MAG: c-type cytochrome [Betaproteobacteria bacterium]|nr:c-type cytochrome [Betaproteobacteria bacterium]
MHKRAEACFACHGKNGDSRTALTPSIGGQPSFFVVAQLFLFRDNRRGKTATPMDEIAKGMSDEDLRAWGEFVSKLPPPAQPAKPADAARYARGRALVEQQRCVSCHNPDFSGREQMPRLANKREDYLLKAMRDYKSGARVGYGSASMGAELAGLGNADFADLAHFLAHLPMKKN